MDILLLNWRDPWHPAAGGAEIVTHEHAKRWVQAGHKVTWVTGGYYEQKKRDEMIDGVRFLRFGGSLTIHLIVPLYLLVKGNTYDVIVDEVHGIPFFSPLFVKKPVIAFIHEVADEIWDYMYRWPISYFGKVLEHWTLRLYRNCQIWTDAPSMIDELVKEGIPRTRCTAIPCPISTTSKNGEGKKWAKETHPTFIFVSRVVRMKGIEEVIKAFSFIVKERDDAALWIVGGGEDAYITQLKQMISEYGVGKQVTFFGRVSEEKKMELMARAHILLHASVREGWGLVVLEAASVGTPSVVYHVPGLCDVVKDRKTGIVISDNSPQEMAKEALMLEQHPDEYRIYQKNGKAWVDSLRWDDAAKQSLTLFKTVSK